MEEKKTKHSFSCWRKFELLAFMSEMWNDQVFSFVTKKKKNDVFFADSANEQLE